MQVIKENPMCHGGLNGPQRGKYTEGQWRAKDLAIQDLKEFLSQNQIKGKITQKNIDYVVNQFKIGKEFCFIIFNK
jgi:hypothetical protein